MKMFALFALLALTTTVNAADIPADQDKIHFVYSDPHVILGVDTTTVKKTDDVISFIGIIYYNPVIVKENDPNATSGRTEVNCKKNTARILTGNDIWYDTKTGEAVKTTPETLSKEDTNWTEIDPKSFLEPMAAYLCHRNQRLSPPRNNGDIEI